MSQFSFFYNDWLNFEPCLLPTKGDTTTFLPVNLEKDFFTNLECDKHSIKKYRIKAAQLCAEMLGDNIALCFSGGIDSQAMLESFLDAKLNFKVYILAFENDLNIQDVEHARLYCKKNNIKLHEIPFNVINFLNRENFLIAEKYISVSPHFNVHYKMFDLLREQGHTGIVCGGNALLCNNDEWGTNFTRNPMNYINYSRRNNFPVQGNFLSFYPKLSWAISLLTRKSYSQLDVSNFIHNDAIEQARYVVKLNGYVRAGFNIIPQGRKFTGFELVKKYYESLTNDTWEFEKRFRTPLANSLQIFTGPVAFKLSKQQLQQIDEIYCQLMSESILFSKYFDIQDSYLIDESDVNNMRPW